MNKNNKVNVIRYADEGFKNYETKIKVNGEIITANGCYAFVRKTFKGALVYNFGYGYNKPHLKNRDKDKKNTIKIDENTIVYGRVPKVENLYFYNSGNCVAIEKVLNSTLKSKTLTIPYSINWCGSQDFKEVTLGELNKALENFENILKLMRDKGYSIKKSEPIYPFYEIFIKI